MKKVWMVAVLCGATMLCGMTLNSEAAGARTRCRVRDGRVRIQIDGFGLTRGIYIAQVRNLTTGARAVTEDGKDVEVTARAAEVDFDFDSTAQPDDFDSFIRPNFARPGASIRAAIIKIDTTPRRAVAAASTTCLR